MALSFLPAAGRADRGTSRQSGPTGRVDVHHGLLTIAEKPVDKAGRSRPDSFPGSNPEHVAGGYGILVPRDRRVKSDLAVPSGFGVVSVTLLRCALNRYSATTEEGSFATTSGCQTVT